MYNNFVEVELNNNIKTIAKDHAIKRELKIVRQFVPGPNAPLAALESNYLGCLGELALRKYLDLSVDLEDSYEDGLVDDGDLIFNGLKYDVKCTGRQQDFYQKLYDGTIKPYDKYGMIDYTSRHVHHLPKYSGGIIFTTFEIPNNAPQKTENHIRSEIFSQNKILIIGFLKQDEILKDLNGNVRKPTFKGPKNPKTGYQVRYYSPNYIFHHTELRSIKELIKE